LIHENPRTFFVIRTHPDETRPGKESRESVSGWVRNKGVDTLPNVLFVGPGETLSSYELIEKSKFVLVYNSTIGLEASILGAAVLCAGRARYTQVDSVFFPKARSEFMALARKFLAAKKIELLRTHQENARKFLYFQLFRTSLPFSDFLKESDYWKGYVCLRDFLPEALCLENSETMRVIQDGIMRGGSFLMPDGFIKTQDGSEVLMKENAGWEENEIP
jgi:hypothetical protein